MRAILTYHSIDPSGSPISISREAFERHCRFLGGGKVAVVPLEEIARVPRERDAVALTFDDGFVNFESEAWPLLRDSGLPATLFVATSRVGASNAWEGRDEPGIPTLPLLGWDALARLASEGLVVGSHSRTHPRLRGASPEQLADELGGSADDLARELGKRPESFCYPYGDHDPRVVEAVRGRYRRACTTELRALGTADDPCRLPRLDAYYLRDPGRLEAWGSPGFRFHLGFRAAARRLRNAVSGAGPGLGTIRRRTYWNRPRRPN